MKTVKYNNLFSVDCDTYYQSECTRKTYKYCVNKFLTYFSRYEVPKQIPNQKIKEWLLTFETLNTRKQMLCSINAFYKLTVGMPKKIKSIPYPKKEKKLPRVIDKKVLLEQISNIVNTKHQAIISLAFSVGLRVSEVINLKIEDIDSKRMNIHIRNAKGRKDRIVPLSPTVLKLLRFYFKEYRPTEYLFNGQTKLKYTSSSANKIVKKYLGSDKHFHLLRHSCFTAMHENGEDISTIKKIAGHSSIKTTLIYTHISNESLQRITLPI